MFHLLEYLEKELYKSYSENLEIRVTPDSPIFREILSARNSSKMKRILNLN